MALFCSKGVPIYCRYCLLDKFCSHKEKAIERNNGNHCPRFMLTYSKLKPDQIDTVESLLKNIDRDQIGEIQLSWAKDHILD